jgi:hypothetical protein
MFASKGTTTARRISETNSAPRGEAGDEFAALLTGSAETEIVDDDLVIRGQMSEDHIDDCSTSPRRLQVDTGVAVRDSSTEPSTS